MIIVLLSYVANPVKNAFMLQNEIIAMDSDSGNVSKVSFIFVSSAFFG